MITRDDVISAYILLLNRAPESEDAIGHWLERCSSTDDLVDGLIRSGEFELRRFKKNGQAAQRLSKDEIASKFSVYPEARFVHWLNNLHALQGMVFRSSAYISAAIAHLQARAGFRGNIAEIGVFHGKYLTGLATSIQAGERAIAVDVFEEKNLNEDIAGYDELGVAGIHSLTQDIFEKNMAMYCPQADRIVFKRSSLDVTPADLMPNGEKIRFFSIDGGHSHDVFLNDLRLAEATLAPHGIISIDDILNDEWPGIATAAVRYFDSRPNLRPVAFIPNKLLCAFESHADMYRQSIRKIAPHSLRRRDAEFSHYTADQYDDGADLSLFLDAVNI